MQLKVTGYSCVRRAKCTRRLVHAEFFKPKISSMKSVSNLILAVEVHCHRVQGMTEAFTDTLYSRAKTSSSVH